MEMDTSPVGGGPRPGGDFRIGQIVMAAQLRNVP
jgi:hypothetical protein